MTRKRVRLDSKFQSKKCAKRYLGDNDRISQLPDDILVSILSLLSLKGAARTSVLSSGWLNLWKHTKSLNFDAGSALKRFAQKIELCSEKRQKFVKLVNSIIRSHKAATLKEFRICLDLSQSPEKVITQWLEFAFGRHVQRLELDLSGKAYYIGPRNPSTYFAFPDEFLSPSSGGSSSSKCCSYSSHIDFKSLKELSLKCVDVTGETIDFFLRNSPLLEKLVVDGTYKLSNLEVCGPSLVLKHLELSCCRNLKSIKVSAPKLTSLIIPDVDELLLENVPMLLELSVMFCHDSVQKLLAALSCCISQLEILTLRQKAYPEEVVLSEFPELSKLKKLVFVTYYRKGDESLMGLTPLIRASPYLQEFVLRFMCRGPSSLDREVKNAIKFPHQHLKVFRFSGYHCRAIDDEFLGYILENCIALQKIIIDPLYPSPYFYLPRNGGDLKEKQAAVDYVKQHLNARVPQHIKLVILK